MRHDVEFDSHGTKCAAWFYVPERDGPCPTIVMAPGLGCIKEMRMDAFAERFCDAGFACLVFDYRHFGASGGEPRQILSIRRQLQDWKAAVAYSRNLSRVDAQNIVLWGFSLSGGHVLAIAAQDPRISAVISLTPHVSGLASLRAERLKTVVRLTMHGLYDSVRGMLGRSPHYVLSTAREGEIGLLNAPGESEDYLGLVPQGMAFDRRVTARFALAIGLYSPGRDLPELAMPTLVQIALNDLTTPAEPVIEACEGAPSTTLFRYQGAHLHPHMEPLFSEIIRDQLEFLKQHVRAQAI